MKQYLSYSPDVEKALESGQPIVALESTVISHGLPYPDNVSVTGEMVKAVLDGGAVPAIIALHQGKIKIGLSDSELEYFANPDNKADIFKASRADLASLIAQEKSGATTVAATMACAALAGIKVFATGGIGGVHRGAEETFDVSADLYEFSKSPVAVVASGAKSILDIPKTLEVLETQGVPIFGYGTDTFPTFYSSTSDYPLIFSFENATELARSIKVQLELTGGGVLIANPIPKEASLDAEQVEAWIDQSLQSAENKGIKGKQVTPFLLNSLAELSEQKTLESNKKLLINNAKTASEISFLI